MPSKIYCPLQLAFSLWPNLLLWVYHIVWETIKRFAHIFLCEPVLKLNSDGKGWPHAALWSTQFHWSCLGCWNSLSLGALRKPILAVDSVAQHYFNWPLRILIYRPITMNHGSSVRQVLKCLRLVHCVSHCMLSNLGYRPEQVEHWKVAVHICGSSYAVCLCNPCAIGCTVYQIVLESFWNKFLSGSTTQLSYEIMSTKSTTRTYGKVVTSAGLTL